MSSVERVRADLGHWWGMSRRVYLVDLLARTATAYSLRRISTYAAALSYYVLFSFFPLLIFIVSVFGLVVRDPKAQIEVTQFILQSVPAGVDLQGNINAVVAEVARTSQGPVGALALFGTFWTASGMFTALRRALNTAFDVPEARSFIKGKAMDLAGVFGVLFFLVVSIFAIVIVLFVVAVTVLLGQMVVPSRVVEQLPLDAAARSFYLMLSYATSYAIILLMYRVVPDRRLRLRDLWGGSALAALGFEVAKFGFGLYLARFGRFQEVYGALGTGVAFLAFVFVVANIVLFTAVLMSERVKDRRNAAPRPATAS